MSLSRQIKWKYTLPPRPHLLTLSFSEGFLWDRLYRTHNLLFTMQPQHPECWTQRSVPIPWKSVPSQTSWILDREVSGGFSLYWPTKLTELPWHLDGNKPKLCIVTVLTSRSIPGVILSLSVLMLIESILGEDRWRMSGSSPHEHVTTGAYAHMAGCPPAVT